MRRLRCGVKEPAAAFDRTPIPACLPGLLVDALLNSSSAQFAKILRYAKKGQRCGNRRQLVSRGWLVARWVIAASVWVQIETELRAEPRLNWPGHQGERGLRGQAVGRRLERPLFGLVVSHWRCWPASRAQQARWVVEWGRRETEREGVGDREWRQS